MERQDQASKAQAHVKEPADPRKTRNRVFEILKTNHKRQRAPMSTAKILVCVRAGGHDCRKEDVQIALEVLHASAVIEERLPGRWRLRPDHALG